MSAKINSEFKKFMGFNVFSGDKAYLNNIVKGIHEFTIINTINPHSFVLTKTDLKFRNSLLNSDILIPDGIGIVLASKILSTGIRQKIAGYDLFDIVMTIANSSHSKVMFIGSTNNVLELITKRASFEFSNVMIDTYSPDYKSFFDTSDLQKIEQRIYNFEPDFIFFGLTAPKQEKLIMDLSFPRSVKIVSGIGAVFDFYAGTLNRPTHFWVKYNLEFLIRFFREPRRLFYRNFVSSPLFLYYVFYEKLFYQKNN